MWPAEINHEHKERERDKNLILFDSILVKRNATIKKKLIARDAQIQNINTKCLKANSVVIENKFVNYDNDNNKNEIKYDIKHSDLLLKVDGNSTFIGNVKIDSDDCSNSGNLIVGGDLTVGGKTILGDVSHQNCTNNKFPLFIDAVTKEVCTCCNICSHGSQCSSLVQIISGVLNSANISAMNTTAQILIPAQGPNTLILVQNVFINVINGTIPVTGVSNCWLIYGIVGNDQINLASNFISNQIGNGSASNNYLHGGIGGGIGTNGSGNNGTINLINSTVGINRPVSITCENASNGGNSSIRWTIFYSVIPAV